MQADFTIIKFYDISLKKWYTQQTRYWDGEKPIPRTRFCADIVHEEGSGTYELYVYGGQQVEDSRLGVDDIWVLTMPAFVWIKIPIPNNFYKTRYVGVLNGLTLVFFDRWEPRAGV